MGSYPLHCLCKHSRLSCGNSLQSCLLERLFSANLTACYTHYIFILNDAESAIKFKLQKMPEFPERKCVVHTRGQLIHDLCGGMCHLCSRGSMVEVFLSSLLENSRKGWIGERYHQREYRHVVLLHPSQRRVLPIKEGSRGNAGARGSSNAAERQLFFKKTAS